MSSISVEDLLDSLWQQGLVEPGKCQDIAFCDGARPVAQSAKAVAAELVHRGVLTPYQAEECLAGRGGRLVVGPYRLLEPLGEGACHRVFRARHHESNQVVALKIFHAPPDPQPHTIASARDARFHREAEAVARMRHPHLVSVLDDGRSGALRYLVREWVDGVGLPKFLEQHGPLEPGQACRLAEQAARALQHAWEHRLVPSTVTASDLILSGRGNSVKLLGVCPGRLGPSTQSLGEFDFGSLLDPGATEEPLERASSFDIEAIRGDAQHALVGLGQVLRLMIHGPRGEAETDTSEPRSVVDQPDPIRAELASVIQRMVSDDLAERYATPADCAAALAHVSSLGQPAGAPSAPLESPAPASQAPSPARSSLPFVVMIPLGVFAGVIVSWFSAAPMPSAPTQPPDQPAPDSLISRNSDRPRVPLPIPPPVEKKPRPGDRRYRALLQAGADALQRDAIAEALVQFGKAILLRPDLAAAYTRRAEASTRWEAHNDVVADCNQAILLEPQDARAYRLRGAALASLGDDAGAIADSTKTIELDEKDAHAFNTRGVAHFNRQEFRAAFEDFRAAVQIDESLAGALGNLAWLLATVPDDSIRNRGQAISCAQRACELTNGNDPVQLKNLAAAHAANHEFAQAIRVQKLALAQSRHLPGAVTDQYRSLLHRYQSNQSPSAVAIPVDEDRTRREENERAQAPPTPASRPAEIHRGIRESLTPFPIGRGRPNSYPPRSIPLHRSN